MSKSIGVYAGSFDPITLGHIDIIERASCLFDSLVVAVAKNTSKSALFSRDEKINLLQSSLAHISNVSIEIFDGLLVDHARKMEATALVRGIRTVADFEYEFKMALTNRQMEPSIETVFLMTDNAYGHLSSSLIKEIASMGGNIAGMVPNDVKQALEAKFS